MESGGVMQLRRKSGTLGPPTNPNNVVLQRRQHQEMQHDLSCYSDEQYSDIGYPSLPRPKAILSLSRAGLPWSSQQASMLGTVPVRVRKSWKSSESKLSCVAQCAAPAEHHHQSVKVNSGLPQAKQQRKRKSLSGIADLFRDRSCSSPAGLTAGRKNTANSITSQPSPPVSSAVAQMSNHSRVQARREAHAPPDGSQEEKSKKSRKPSKSMTFSFGSGSDKKRRTLGFLGRGDKKNRKPSPIPPTTPVTPSSPILVSRKASTLPVSAGLSYKEVPVHPKFTNALPVRYGSYQDVTGAKSPSRGKHRPPPLRNLSGSVGQHLCHTTDTEDVSPLTDYSPGLTSTSGGMSSRPDSMESLPISSLSEASHTCSSLTTRTATPPASHRVGGRESPMVSRCAVNLPPTSITTTQYKSPAARRKFSDPTGPPAPGAADAVDGPSAPPPTRLGRTLKKRNTFCVRPSQVNLEQEWKEMRQHVVRFLVETEQSYVESLRTILKVYYDPLRRPQAKDLVDPALVKEIFYQIPEICSVHEHFLKQLTQRVEHWNADRKIGDIFINTFSKCHLMDIYQKFIGNFMRAKASIELAKQSKSVFSKFLEQRARDSEGKLTLDDLLIKPVQRIPRYVLFVKDLLKHTAPSHPDHTPLQQALGELTMLAEKVNESERERERVGQHRELLGAVDGLAQLLSPDSRFISHSMVTEVKGNTHKRDRFLILFSDILVCAASRRKSTSFKRSSMLNLNSVFAEGLKYNIKWQVPLTKTSVAQVQVPFFDARRQNTLEKMVENLRKDEAVVQDMVEMSCSLHHPHQGLMTALKELQMELRDSVAAKRVELDNLPVENGRIDLISYSGSPPTQYTVIFPSQKIKNQWKAEFLQVKEAADIQAPPSASVAPPTSPLPVPVMNGCEGVEFQGQVDLPSVRPGMQLTCAAEGLTVGSSPGPAPSSSGCLWVCCNDGLGGQVSLLSLSSSSLPQILASITISDTPITSIATIPAPPTTQTTPPLHGQIILPNISVNSMSSSSSGSDHVTISPTSSFDREEEMIFMENELEMSTNSVAMVTSSTKSQLTDSLTVGGFTRVRSNSAPPIPPEDLGHHRVPSPATGQQSLSAQSSINDGSEVGDSATRKVSSALTLRPAVLEGEGQGGVGDSMWLGTEGGQLHIYRVGDSLRCRTQRRVVELGAAVSCLRHCDGTVYVGLSDGTLVLLDASDPAQSPRHTIMVGGGPIMGCVCVLGQLWVACGCSLFSLDQSTFDLKVVCTLPSGQLVEGLHVTGNAVWVSVQRSPLLHLLHAPSGVLLTTIDCAVPVRQALVAATRAEVSRQHLNGRVSLTSLQSSPTHLVIGTSAGVVLTLLLPFIQPSLEPHPLLRPPSPTPLHHRHGSAVHFISVVQREGVPLLLTGGSGHNCVAMATKQNIQDTAASCLLTWKLQ